MNVKLDILVMVTLVRTSMNANLLILAIPMQFASIMLVRTLVSVKMVLMEVVLLVMITTSVIKILVTKMLTAPIL